MTDPSEIEKANNKSIHSACRDVTQKLLDDISHLRAENEKYIKALHEIEYLPCGYCTCWKIAEDARPQEEP